MKPQWRLYDCGIIIDRLTKLDRNTVKAVLKEYLGRGAHPFFLEQIIRFRCRTLDAAQTQEILGVAENALRKSYSNSIPVPGCHKSNHQAAVSRLYNNNWKQPQSGLSEGILQGALVETVIYLYNSVHAKFPNHQLTEREILSIAELFLTHPNANVGLMDNVIHQINAFTEWADFFDPTTKRLYKIEDQAKVFLLNQVRQHGLVFVVNELLCTWNDPGVNRFWNNLYFLLSTLTAEPDIHKSIIRSILEAVDSKNSLRRYAARCALALYPYASRAKEQPEDAFSVKNCLDELFCHLKDQPLDVETYHLLVRWFSSVPREIQEILVFSLIFSISGEGKIQVNPNTEFLIEELLGSKTWEALCAFQDERYWQCKVKTQRDNYFGRVDESTEEYKLFLRRLKATSNYKHDWQLATQLDTQIHTIGLKELERARLVWDEAVNILGGDTLLAVTHLRSEWMPVRRKPEEYLYGVFPVVEISKHPELGENGVACIFRITLPDNVENPVLGDLNPEGVMKLHDIRAITPGARKALEAVVAQTLVCVLVPRYLEKFPPAAKAGAEVSFTGEVWAARPIIHTLGDLQYRPELQLPSAGTKINPQIAELLFSWLLDESFDCQFRLYREARENKPPFDTYYLAWHEAKTCLVKKEAGLANVFLRIVRAHTKPVGVFLNPQGDVIVQKMSDRAQRNYERFLLDIGRKLDFSFVRKTYILPEGRRIVLDVPRTFNQGAFASLTEVWKMIPDLALKVRAKEKFIA